MNKNLDDSRSNRVQVVVRVRPTSGSELTEDVAVTCANDGSKVQVVLPDKLTEKQLLPGVNKNGARSYEFDACLAGEISQEELWDICGLQELVEAALDGYCVTIFAYGQTGSGKTHTVIGPHLSKQIEKIKSGGSLNPSELNQIAVGLDSEDGLLSRCLYHAFEGIAARANNTEFSVSESCVEIYNENVTDLLASDKEKPLHVKMDARGGFQVAKLTQLPCGGPSAALRQLQKALVRRHTRAHRMNEYSSRSHCIMTFLFASKETVSEPQTQDPAGPQGESVRPLKRFGKLCLVDLAGSERLKQTGNTDRDSVRETGAINKSLFTLGQTLAALSLSCNSNGGAPPFIPYRNSKLTQLLWDGLRGTGRCLMLACLGPQKQHVEESLNTLHFASVALRIKSEPVVLLDPQDKLLLDLKSTIVQLRHENRQLAVALQHLSQGADPDQVFTTLPESFRSEALNLILTAGNLSPARGLPASSLRETSAGPVHSPSPGRGWYPGPPRGARLSDPAVQVGVPGGSSGPPTPLRTTYSAGPLQPLSLSLSEAAAAAAAPRLTSRVIMKPESKLFAAKSSAPFQNPKPRSIDLPASNGLAPGVSPTKPPLPNLRLSAPRLSSSSPPDHSNGGNGSVVSSSYGGGGGGGGALPFAVPAAVEVAVATAPSVISELESFPELAAMEAEFQQMMQQQQQQSGAEGPCSPTRKPLSSSLHKPENERGSSLSKVPAPWEEEGYVVAEPKALGWAQQNPWFGSDDEMTAYAYAMHDQLVGPEGADPTSDEYYSQIELRLEAAFPLKWARFQEEKQAAEEARAAELRRSSQRAAAAAAMTSSGAAGKPNATKSKVPSSSSQVSSVPGSNPPSVFPPPAPYFFGRGLRMNLKDPMTLSLSASKVGGLPSPGQQQQPQPPTQQHLVSPDSSYSSFQSNFPGGSFTGITAPLGGTDDFKSKRGNSGKLMESRRSSGSSSLVGCNGGEMESVQGSSRSHSNLTSPLPRSSSSGLASAHVMLHPSALPSSATSVNPFNVQALHIAAPPKMAANRSPARKWGGQTGQVYRFRGSAAAKNWLSPYINASSSNKVDYEGEPLRVEKLQQEYQQQRAVLLNELRLAKEEAETERKRIMAKINGTMRSRPLWT